MGVLAFLNYFSWKSWKRLALTNEMSVQRSDAHNYDIFRKRWNAPQNSNFKSDEMAPMYVELLNEIAVARMEDSLDNGLLRYAQHSRRHFSQNIGNRIVLCGTKLCGVATKLRVTFTQLMASQRLARLERSTEITIYDTSIPLHGTWRWIEFPFAISVKTINSHKELTNEWGNFCVSMKLGFHPKFETKENFLNHERNPLHPFDANVATECLQWIWFVFGLGLVCWWRCGRVPKVCIGKLVMACQQSECCGRPPSVSHLKAAVLQINYNFKWF